MICHLCHLVVGTSYEGIGIVMCHECGTEYDTTGKPQQYVGLLEGEHVFRIHRSVKCEGCQTRLMYICSPCGNLEDREYEYAQLFGLKESER